MISGLNKKFKANEQTVYEDLPEGKYLVKVESFKKVKDTKDTYWEKQTKKNAQILVRDENGYPKKDDKGKLIRETVAELEWYTCNMTLKVLEGKYKDRLIWADLTTHPDAAFITEGFLYAVNEEEMVAGDIPKECVNKVLLVDVFHNTYDKKIVDKDTGLETVEKRTNVKVKTFLRPELVGDVAGL